MRAYQFFGNKKQDTLYQLSDYFTLFYYKFLKNNSGKDERFWSNSIDNPSVRAWEGFTFEQVCKDIRKWIDCHMNPVRVSVNFSIDGVISAQGTAG